MPKDPDPAPAATQAPTQALAEVEELDATEAPICVLLRPGDIRDLHALIQSFPLKVSGLPNAAEFEAMVRLRRVRTALDVALQKAGLPPLDLPRLNGQQ